MNLFNMFNRNSKQIVDDLDKNRKTADGKLFKTVKTISILGIFIASGLMVLGIFNLLKLNAVTFGIIGTIASICIGSWLMLPWVAYLEQKKNKKLSIIFICLDTLVPVLWIFSIWFLVGSFSSGNIGFNTLTFIKIVFIISLQFSVASFMSNTILRYGKRLLVVQIIAYVSYIFIDFYVSYALFCISFTENDGMQFSEAISLLGNRFMVTLFVLALLYVVIAFSIINGGPKRRRTLGDAMTDILLEDDTEKSEPIVEKKQTPEEQLQALQNLLDKKLITQEEYDEKRKSILDKM